MLRILIGVIVIAVLVALATLQIRKEPTNEFIELASLTVDGNAEILSADPTGNLLAFTSADDQTVGIVDLSDPMLPIVLGTVEVPGEPTSVGMSPDGQWALAVVHVSDSDKGDEPPDLRLPGVLALLDLRDPTTPLLASVIGIGNHPDSIAVTTAGDELVAVIAIENERVWVRDGAVVDEDDTEGAIDISAPGAIQIVKLNPAKPGNWSVATLALDADYLRNAMMIDVENPQPEYVALSPGRHMAAVSLQDNNGIVLIDLAAPELAGAFNLGTVANRLADLIDDGKIELTQNYPADASSEPMAGVRYPDAIAFSPDGQYLLSANEGEQALTGGRGFSIWALNGELVWDDGGEIEQRAFKAGLYPDKRSDKRGIEVEGITAARFGSRDFAFAVSERGSFLVIYDISNPYAPEFVQILPTGDGPESVVALPSRNLVIVAAEDSGTISVFQFAAGDPAANETDDLFGLPELIKETL